MKTSQILNVILAAVILLLILKTSFSRNNTDVTQQSADCKDAIENIMARKSVRSYEDKEVDDEKISVLLKAAMAAPSGKDIRPWEFIVVKDRAVLDQMGDALPYAKMLKDTRQAIVVCGDTTKSSYWYLDCSAATQNILLAAEATDLGAVWTAAYPYDDRMAVVKKALNLPDHILPLCVIPFGYPSGEQKAKDKYDMNQIHHDKY